MSMLRTTTRNADTGPVLEVFGDLDYASAPELRALVSTVTLRPGQRLVLDLGGMEFCDSSGITALIAARSHALDSGADIALAAVPSGTQRILRITGLDQIFTLHPDAGSATRP